MRRRSQPWAGLTPHVLGQRSLHPGNPRKCLGQEARPAARGTEAVTPPEPRLAHTAGLQLQPRGRSLCKVHAAYCVRTCAHRRSDDRGGYRPESGEGGSPLSSTGPTALESWGSLLLRPADSPFLLRTHQLGHPSVGSPHPLSKPTHWGYRHPQSVPSRTPETSAHPPTPVGLRARIGSVLHRPVSRPLLGSPLAGPISCRRRWTCAPGSPVPDTESSERRSLPSTAGAIPLRSLSPGVTSARRPSLTTRPKSGPLSPPSCYTALFSLHIHSDPACLHTCLHTCLLSVAPTETVRTEPPTSQHSTP